MLAVILSQGALRMLHKDVSADVVDPEQAVGQTEDPCASAGGAGDGGESDREEVTALVRGLHDGRVLPGDLSLEMRQRCVDHLTLEGFASGEIAELMKISERTVRRDRAAIRRDHAVEPDLRLGDELLGEFQRIILASIQRLVRLARDPETPAYARLWAEESIVRMYQRLIDTAQRMNYISNGGRRLSHHRVNDPEEQKRFKEQMKGMMKTVGGSWNGD